MSRRAALSTVLRLTLPMGCRWGFFDFQVLILMIAPMTTISNLSGGRRACGFDCSILDGQMEDGEGEGRMTQEAEREREVRKDSE